MSPDLVEALILISIVVGTFAFIIGIYWLVAHMARKRNRDAAVWVLLAFLLTPFLVMLVLLIAGKRR